MTVIITLNVYSKVNHDVYSKVNHDVLLLRHTEKAKQKAECSADLHLKSGKCCSMTLKNYEKFINNHILWIRISATQNPMFVTMSVYTILTIIQSLKSTMKDLTCKIHYFHFAQQHCLDPKKRSRSWKPVWTGWEKTANNNNTLSNGYIIIKCPKYLVLTQTNKNKQIPAIRFLPKTAHWL